MVLTYGMSVYGFVGPVGISDFAHILEYSIPTYSSRHLNRRIPFVYGYFALILSLCTNIILPRQEGGYFILFSCNNFLRPNLSPTVKSPTPLDRSHCVDDISIFITVIIP